MKKRGFIIIFIYYFFIPSCCPSPRTSLWVKPALCTSLTLHRSQTESVERPWRDGNPPNLQGEVHSALTALVALPRAGSSRQDRLHRAFVTALSPQPSLLSSFHHPDQKVPEKPSRIWSEGFQKRREIFLEVPTGSESYPEPINSQSKTTLGTEASPITFMHIEQHPR